MDNKPITVLLVEDEQALRQLTSWFLQEEGGIEVIGEAADGEEAVTLADKHTPDIILMDVSLGSMNDLKGVDATRKILALHPEQKVIGYSIHEHPHYVREMVKAGACGYFSKLSDDMKQITHVIKTVFSKHHYFSKSVALALKNKDEEKSPYEILSPVESEILLHIVQGKPLKEIAAMRNVTISTVDTQRRNILNKLHCRSDVELVLHSLRHGLIEF
ncbi:MAG: response regulator transcription factor [Ignavibacteriae bacterium]|nr:response regulator transcription factor [Ignavibacteriota bacterium]